MKKRKYLKLILIILAIGFVVVVGIVTYMYNMSPRDVISAKADYSLTSTEIVNEYLNDFEAANKKYLSADGHSKILEISGVVNEISTNIDGEEVILLKNEGDKAGVIATFTLETNKTTENLRIGDSVAIKGIIRAGASYDDDFELYENVILEECDVVK